MLQVSEKVLRELICDPVLACEVILGWELDTYQKAALRFDWWFPETIDSSGVSTGKTLRVFVFANLRCILLPQNVCGVYFPNFQTGKDEFWPYFERTMEQSPIFADQLVMHRRKLGESKAPGAWSMNYVSGSRLIMPAPSFLTDSQTQATRRFNTLVVDDWLVAETMGEGIGKQLVSRVTRPCFNQEHPIWCNHIHFKGHAQSPTHKGYQRVRAYKRLIRDGSTRHALYSFCFKDISPKFQPLLLNKHTIQSERSTKTRDEFMRMWLGLWTRDGATYYPETVLELAARGYFAPAYGRTYENEVNILGFDVAAGMSHRADYSAAVVIRLVPLPSLGKTYDLKLVDGTYVVDQLPENYTHEDGRRFNVCVVFAFMFQGRSAPETSGFLHGLHRRFAFALIVLDPGGGGLWIYAELKKPKQTIEGREVTVVPLCTPNEPLYHDKQPIVHFFKRKSAFDDLPFIEPQFLTGDEGFIAACHLRYREAWQAAELHVPATIEERKKGEVEQWTREQVTAQKVIDIGIKQLANVRQLTNKAGEPQMSSRGFPLFIAQGKKDVAYAQFYSFIGAMLWLSLQQREEETKGADENYFQVW